MGRWSDVLTLYRWELRSALRDRTIAINSVVLPIVLYPALLWLVFTGITFVRGQTADLASRVAVVGLPAAHQELARRLAEHERIQVVTDATTAAEAEEEVRSGRLDVALDATGDESAADPTFHTRLLHDGSRDRSRVARERVAEIVRLYREESLRREAIVRGVEPAAWTAFAIERRNVASPREVGAFFLGLVPLFFVIMVALGCLYPAIDTTAGERERGTWETLMTTAASRTHIVAAKYLAVTTLGMVAGLLNVGAMVLTFRGVFGPMLQGAGRVEFAVPPLAFPILLLGAALLAGLLAAGMMLLSAFARTFREGQAAASAFYLASILPIILVSNPGTQLTLGLAFVPVANVALAVREALRGTFHSLEVLVAFAASIVYILVLVRLAALVLAVENIVTGSYSGSLLTFVTDRLRGRSPAARGGQP